MEHTIQHQYMARPPGPPRRRSRWARARLPVVLSSAGHIRRGSPLSTSRRPPAGSVLALVLIVLSSMVILSAGLSYRTRIDLRLAQAYARRTQAHYLAMGGLARAAVLMAAAELSPRWVAALGRFARTAGEERLFEQLQGSGLESHSLAYRVRDEQEYLNVNQSDPAAWSGLSGIDAELMAGLLDWIDTDDNVRSQGAEADYYSRLSSPYTPKNLPCAFPKELLLVRGVTRERYMGSELSSYQKVRAGAAAERNPPASGPLGTEINFGLLDLFTVFGNGKINVNTVGKAVLTALPGLDEQAAQAVLTRLAGTDGILGTADDVALTSTQELTQIEGVTALQAELLGQYCCFRSTTFRIFSLAELSDGSLCALVATMDVSRGRPAVLCVERLR